MLGSVWTALIHAWSLMLPALNPYNLIGAALGGVLLGLWTMYRRQPWMDAPGSVVSSPSNRVSFLLWVLVLLAMLQFVTGTGTAIWQQPAPGHAIYGHIGYMLLCLEYGATFIITMALVTCRRRRKLRLVPPQAAAPLRARQL